MSAKNPYDLLGVTSRATAEEIRSAYVKRTKVLHPDRFDQLTQPVEWQMANDMLQDLNQAYAELKIKGCANENYSSSSYSQPSPGASNAERIDLVKSQRTWDAAGAIFLKAEQTPVEDLRKDNFDRHMLESNRYVGINFESQLAISQFSLANVDQLVIEGLSLLLETLSQYSTLYTERITILLRAKFLRDKYPFWKTLWIGWQSMGITAMENEADRAEMNSLTSRLAQMATEATAVQAKCRSGLSVTCMNLIAKYGDKFVV